VISWLLNWKFVSRWEWDCRAEPPRLPSFVFSSRYDLRAWGSRKSNSNANRIWSAVIYRRFLTRGFSPSGFKCKAAINHRTPLAYLFSHNLDPKPVLGLEC
jgi:hypothetical protein